jgi:hypothetical protein
MTTKQIELRGTLGGGIVSMDAKKVCASTTSSARQGRGTLVFQDGEEEAGPVLFRSGVPILI